MIKKLMQHRFLFEELVKRDFKTKYKRTALGIGWSLLSPLLLLLVLKLVFTNIYGRTTPHFSIYLFCGVLVWNYFTEATKGGMRSLMDNAGIFTKVNVPKYLFLLSKNVQALISFLLTLVILYIFIVFDTLIPTLKYFCLLYPIVCLVLFNIGVGMILSALYIFFRDMQYLYDIFTRLLMYLSAVFYTIDRFSERAQSLFLLNPLYLFIRYFRSVIIEDTVPDLRFHLFIAVHVLIALGLGCWMYKKNNTKFLYYV
jgi:ABC-type polysaccharide/polyol phosphate export systems, permease component